MGEKYVDVKNSNSMEKFTVQLMDPLLYDKLYILAAEYSISVETLINIAIKRFIEDIDFVRSLRVGKTIQSSPFYSTSFSKQEKSVRNTFIAICFRSKG